MLRSRHPVMVHKNYWLCNAGMALVAAIVLARSAVFLWWSELHFDADQAVIGLMAKHLAEGRALPVFQYAQQYVLVLESWLAAPLVATMGAATPSIIKCIPVLFNLATGVLLYRTLCRTVRLGPWAAAAATLPVAIPGPTTTEDLTDALGMNIEPLFFSLVIWHLRERPIPLGVTAAIAVLNREFVVYALAALALVELLRDRSWLFAWRPHAIAMVAFLLTWTGVRVLAQYSSPLGPGTTFARVASAGTNVAAAAAFVCFDPAAIDDAVRTVATRLLPAQFGMTHERVGGSTFFEGSDWRRRWLWPALAGLMLLGIGRGLLRARREGPSPATWFGIYLVLIGAQAIAAYAILRCGHIGLPTLRYTLLALFVPVGAITLAMERERLLGVKTAFVAAIVLWAGLCALDHIRLGRALVVAAPAPYRELADHLVERRIEFIITDYWTGYHVAFLTGERVRPMTDFNRVLTYTQAVRANQDRAVEVWRRRRGGERCAGAVEIAAWYICPPIPRDPRP